MLDFDSFINLPAGRKSYARVKRIFVPTVRLLVKFEDAVMVNLYGLFMYVASLPLRSVYVCVRRIPLASVYSNFIP